MAGRLWNFMMDLDPNNWAEANDNANAIIEDDESKRNAVVAGVKLGQFQERNWIKACFERAQGDQIPGLIGRLLDGTFPKAFRDEEPGGRVLFYEFEEDCPDGPMD